MSQHSAEQPSTSVSAPASASPVPESSFTNPYSSPQADPAIVEVVAADDSADAPRPWGFWMTWLWAIPLAIVVVIVQVVVVVAFLLLQMAASGDFEPRLDGIETNGLLLSLSTFTSAATVAIGLLPIIWLRRLRFADYLGLDVPSLTQVASCTALLIAIVVVSDGLTWLTGRPLVPEFMIETHATASFLPLFWLTLVVAAPLGEELVFRGFLLAPHGSALVKAAGLVLSSATWAAIHQQYDLWAIGLIFASGLILGGVRLVTGSTTLTIIMHALMNLIATLELYAYLYLF